MISRGTGTIVLQLVDLSDMKNLILFCFLGVGIIALLSCKNIKPPELPGNCSIHRRDTGVYDIVDSQKLSSKGVPLRPVLVDADVSKVAVVEHYVLGYCEPYMKGGDLGTIGGYFCLDTNKKISKEGMTLKEYQIYIRTQIGLKKDPELKAWRKY